MSYQEDRFLEIANAIREKDGTSEPIKATDFANRILNIPSGGGVELDEYYYQVAQVLISADRLQYLQEAWESRNQITVNASGNVTEVTGTLEDIVIPEEALTIPNSDYNSSPFYPHRESAKSLTLPSNLGLIGNYAFYSCSGFTGSLTISNSVTSIGESAFRSCSGFTGSLIIPNSVTSIGLNVFSGCSGFTGSLTISNSVTNISNSVFSNCSGFTGSLIIPNSVTSIGGYAFYNCSGFTGSLIIPNSVTSIGTYVFQNCSGFTSVVFDGQAPTLGSRVFQGCTAVLEYDFTNCTSVPALGNINVFTNINANCQIKVPLALAASWKAATNWVTYADYIIGV